MRQIKLIIAALFLISPFAANADPITYEYDSGAFGPNANGVTNMTALFTIDIAPNTTASGTSHISSDFWSISDGVTSIDPSSSDYALDFFWASSDAFGVLNSFKMAVLYDPHNTVGHPIPVGSNYHQEIRFNFSGLTQAQSYYCTGADSDGRCNRGRGSTGGQSPTLSVVSIPEPGTLALFGIGLFGIGLARRRRKV